MKSGSGYKGDDDDKNPFAKAFQITGQSKVKPVCEFLNVLIENGAKFILFCHHIATLDEYEAYMKKSKVKYMRIDGSTNSNKKHENVKIFEEDTNMKCALLSITAAYQGITLVSASTVVFAEFYWTPAIMQQAED